VCAGKRADFFASFHLSFLPPFASNIHSQKVGIDGTIDHYCYPRFDSPTIFARILDLEKGGYFSLKPKVFIARDRWPSQCTDT